MTRHIFRRERNHEAVITQCSPCSDNDMFIFGRPTGYCPVLLSVEK